MTTATTDARIVGPMSYQLIGLDQLMVDPQNVRKAAIDPRAVAELEASIEALGVLENLIVRKGKAIVGKSQSYYVVGGGLRLVALRNLASRKVIPDHC